MEYQRSSGFLGSLGFFTISNIEAKSYSPNIPTAAWNLETKATEFLMTVFEEDSTEEITETTTMNSEFATNFGIDLDLGISEIVKLGLKFGISNKDTRSNTVALKKTLITDDLGDFVINFGDKVVLSETTVGSITFYPKRWYGVDNQYLKFQFYPKRVQ